jgi:wolfamin
VKVPAPATKGILKLSNRQESKVVIKAEHAFGNFTQRINASDKIWFKGILRTSLSTKADDAVLPKPQQSDDAGSRMFTRVELTAISCLQCSDKNLASFTTQSKLKMESHLKELRRGLKYLLNVLFNPLVTFK